MKENQLIEAGATLVCRVGLQGRPVYELNGQLWEKAIHFDDGHDHTDFYQVGAERATELRIIAAAQFTCSPEGHKKGSGAMQELKAAVKEYNAVTTMIQISWDRYGTVDGSPLSVTAVGSGYREAIHTPFHQEDGGNWVGSMSYMRSVQIGYEGSSKPVRVSATIIEEARRVALAHGVKKVRWNGAEFFPMP